MSFQAQKWADDQVTGKQLNKHVLEKLANYADENHSCFPSYDHLAKKCECNVRTIMRTIKSLEYSGFIKIEPRFTKDGRQTSNRFILNVRGDKYDTHRVTDTTPDPIRTIIKDNINKRGDKKDTPYSSEFEEWWNVYPNNAGSKTKAFESWVKATDLFIDKNELFLITCRFKQSQVGKEQKYIPHPTTWLNQKRWETVQEIRKKQVTKNQLAG